MGCHRDKYLDQHFFIYINDFDSRVSKNISKFADDMEMGRIIWSNSDAIAMQADLDRIDEWTGRWQVQFSINKCKVLSLGRGNPQNTSRYTINNKALMGSEYERKIYYFKKQCIEARN